jgi:2-aminoadipate transaminase
MEYRFAKRMGCLPPSFLGELFRVSSQPGIISFAGGLPGTDHIDIEGLARASRQVMEEEGRSALQYSTTDGYLPLREYIADRYRRRLNIPARADEIQIVNGSQQCLDLVAKILVNPGDPVGMERPGYLGAIEAFSLYEPVIHTVPLTDSGPDLDFFSDLLTRFPLRFFYGIPNSQNPSGRTYTRECRRAIAELLEGTDTLFYEDDAFGELFFDASPGFPSSGSSRSRVSCQGLFQR